MPALVTCITAGYGGLDAPVGRLTLVHRFMDVVGEYLAKALVVIAVLCLIVWLFTRKRG